MFQGKLVIYSIIFGGFLELFILKTAKADISGCHFLHTVNLTDSQSFENGSYMYEDIKVPVNLTGQYDYITTELKINETTESHLRGCVCRLKPCIWICCRFKDWDPSNGKCNDGLMGELSEINPLLYVTLGNGSVEKKNLLQDFIVLRDRMRFFDFWDETEYTFFENGSLLFNSSNTNVRGYDCLHPNQFTSASTKSFVVAIHRFIYAPKEQQDPIMTTLSWLSNVSFLLTIAVYLFVKKLRNLHGKCFICYMITSILCEISSVIIPIDFKLCVLRAYFLHFLQKAKFSWLLALSHQLWRGLRSVNRGESEYSFGAYSIFSWGTPTVYFAIVFLIDQIWNSEPNKVKWVPGMGWEGCDFKVSSLMYGYIPVALIVLLNTILFIWTTISIIRVKLLLRHLSDHHERKQNLNSGMETYYLFLRLAVVMDIKWSVHVISDHANWNILVRICWYCESCIGIVIFVLFVLKRSTLKLLMESIRKRRKEQQTG